MKNIFWASIIILVFLPQLTFGADQAAALSSPQTAAFIKQQDADSIAFFQQQAAERADFMKQHPDIIAKMDQQGRAMLEYKNALSHQGSAGYPSSLGAPPAPVVDDTYSAFMQKQLSDKEAFLAKQIQEKDSFLKAQ